MNIPMRILLVGACLVTATPSLGEQSDCFGQAPSSVFSRDIQPVFDKYCVSCHQDKAAASGLSLQSGTSARGLPNAISREGGGQLVVPGNADASFLYRKLTNMQGKGKGERMPLAGQLGTGDLSKFRDWINSCGRKK